VLVLAVGFASGCGGSATNRTVTVGASASTAVSSPGSSRSPSPATTGAGAPPTPAAAAPGATSTGKTPDAGSSVIATANTICARRNKELVAVSTTVTDLHAIAKSASARLAIEQRALGELGKLTPPAKDARDYEKVLAYMRLDLRHLLQLSSAARSNDAAGVASAKAALETGALRLLGAGVRAGTKACSTFT
jgi:hypothetical protein